MTLKFEFAEVSPATGHTPTPLPEEQPCLHNMDMSNEPCNLGLFLRDDE
jgi:hypothetical protein